MKVPFTFDGDIAPPDAEYDITDWTFQVDLRPLFPLMHDNNEIGEELQRRGVVTENDTLDTESACTWVYFQTEQAALVFIVQLNAQPEIQNYVEPKPQKYVAIRDQDWDVLVQFLNANMDEKTLKAMVALGIEKHLVELE